MKKNNMTQFNTKKNKKVSTGPFCFLTWVLKVEIIIIIIFLLINIVNGLISEKTKFVMKFNMEKFICRDTKKENVDIDDIFASLEKDNNLSIEEKDFIKESLKNEIEENIEYIDTSNLSKRLKNLKSSFNKKYKYNERSKEYEIQNIDMYLNKIAGKYNSFFNEINIFEQIDDNKIPNDYIKDIFNFSTCDKRVYFHELNHLITKNTSITLIKSYTTDLANERRNNWFNLFSDSSKTIDKEIFLESINEMFTLEYLQNSVLDIYDEDMIYAYVLAEILPEETIRRYKFYDNQSIIISELLKIDNNMDEVYKLFYSINKVLKNQETENDLKNIHDGYSYFYEKKYNKSMSKDIEILSYFYGTNIQTEEERKYIRDYLNMKEYDEILKVVPKGYFSSEYKENHDSVYIEYTENGEIQKKKL